MNKRGRLMGFDLSSSRANALLFKLLVAAAGIILVTVFRWMLTPFLGSKAQLLPYFLAVIATAALAGFKFGVLASILSAVVGTHVFVTPIWNLGKLGSQDWFHTLFFVTEAILISWIIDLLRRSQADVSKARAEGAEQFKNLANAMTQLAWIARPDGHIYWYNSRWYEYTGTTFEEMEGWGWEKVHHPDHVERVVSFVKEAWKRPEAWELTFPLRSTKGEWRWFLTRAVPLTDSQGEITQWFGTNTDIHTERETLERLKESEAKLRIMTDVMPQIVWSALPDGFHDYYNKQWYEFTGVPEGSTDGEGWNAIFHPDDQERAWKAWRHSLATGEPYEIEYRLRHHSGEYRWTLGRALPVRNGKNEVVRWMGTCTDIHDVMSAEAEIKFQAELTRTITDNAASCLFMMDKNGHPTFMNPAARMVTGYESLDEIKDRPLHYAVHWKKPDGSDYPMEECPIDNAQAEKKEARNQEEIFCRKDGSLFPVSYSVKPLSRDGEVVGSVLEFRDVTEEKRKERQLSKLAEISLVLNSQRDLESKFQIIVDAARDLIGAHQAVTSITVGNDWSQSINAISLSDKYAAWKDYAEPPNGSGIYSLVCRTNRTMRFTQAELEAHPAWKGFGAHKDKHPPMRGWLAVPLVGAGGVNLGLIQVSDRYAGEFTREDEAVLVQLAQISASAIEMAQLLEREKQAVKARDEFLSIASHELKTPLTSLKLQSQLHQRAIQKDDPTAYSQERVDAAIAQTDKQVNRLTRLVDDMLDVSRIRSGRLQIEPEEMDLCEVVEDVIERLRAQFENASYQPPVVERCEKAQGHWDRIRIEQVVTNLLTNAIRYGKGNAITVRVKTEGSKVRLSVKDQGIGVKPEARERIFDRFERAISANEVSGLGLGLFISKQIVLAHGGQIWVESEPGQGSTFFVEFPISGPASSGGDLSGM